MSHLFAVILIMSIAPISKVFRFDILLMHTFLQPAPLARR